MTKTDPGAIAGLEFAGYPGKAGEQDFAICVSTISVNFILWHICSGDITWEPDKEDVNGWWTFDDCCTQDRFMELMEKLAKHYDADIIQYQYDDYEPFKLGALTDTANAPYWVAYWFFPTREVDCSAVLRIRPKAAEEAAEAAADTEASATTVEVAQ